MLPRRLLEKNDFFWRLSRVIFSLQCGLLGEFQRELQANSALIFPLRKFALVCEGLNTKTGRICHKHFTSDDFERNLQVIQIICWVLRTVHRNDFKLKPGTVPSVTNTAVLANNTSARAKAKENKILIQSLLKEPEVPDEIVLHELNELSVERNEVQGITFLFLAFL